MKKRLAKWFLLVAKRLDPETHIENAQVIEDYEAQKIGLTYEVDKSIIKEFRFKGGARMSYREAVRCVLSDCRKNIRKHIIGCIDASHLIEYTTTCVKDGGYQVSGEIKVYVPKLKMPE